ncbi:MAG: hypothetical protein ABL872_13205 [Lacibacter sp.]
MKKIYFQNLNGFPGQWYWGWLAPVYSLKLCTEQMEGKVENVALIDPANPVLLPGNQPAPKFSPIAKFRIFLLVHYRLTLTFAASLKPLFFKYI